MNAPIIRHLVAKDLYLHRWPLLLYFGGGLVSLALLTSTAPGPFYAGSVLLLSMVIVTSAHLVFSTLVTERNEQTLALILSLPVTFLQYTHAKICANVLAFGLSWTVLVLGALWVIHSQPQIPNGLAVYTVILMVELFAVFILLLSVALVTESQTWTVVLVSVTNMGLALFMFWLSSLTQIRNYMYGPEAVWNETALTIVGMEFVFVLVCLGATYWLQSRKRDFL